MKAIVSSEGDELNRLVCDELLLPDVVGGISSTWSMEVPDQERGTILNVCHQAIWAANKVLDGGAKSLVMDEMGEKLHVKSSTLGFINNALGDLTDSLKTFS